MNKLFQYFVTSLFFMILGYCIGVNYIPYEFVAAANTVLAVVMVILLLLTWIIKGRKKRGLPKFSMGWVYLFTFIDGILLYPTLMYYFATLGTVLFLNIIISTLLIFSVLSYIGFKQKSGSFIGLGKVLFVALTILVIMSIVNLFLHIGWMPILLSAAGIVIFSAYILVDINQFKTAYEAGLINEKEDYSIFVLNIYLDVINLLLDILSFANRLKE